MTMLDGISYKDSYTLDQFSKMEYFRYFKSCKVIEKKIVDKISGNQFEIYKNKDFLTIQFKFILEGEEFTSSSIDLTKEAKMDLNKTNANLKEIIKMQQIEIKSVKEEINKLNALFSL